MMEVVAQVAEVPLEPESLMMILPHMSAYDGLQFINCHCAVANSCCAVSISV